MCGTYAVIEGGQRTACVDALMTAMTPYLSTYDYNEDSVAPFYLAQESACPRRD
jgi:hypothetical protein